MLLQGWTANSTNSSTSSTLKATSNVITTVFFSYFCSLSHFFPPLFWIFTLSKPICAHMWCQVIKQGSRRPSLDVHSCPQSAEYDCSPQAKERATGLNIFSLFKRFPGVLETGHKKWPPWPTDAMSASFPPLSPFFFFSFSLVHFKVIQEFKKRVCVCVRDKHLFPKALHTFWGRCIVQDPKKKCTVSLSQGKKKIIPSWIIQQPLAITSTPGRDADTLETSQRRVGVLPLHHLSTLQPNLALF